MQSLGAPKTRSCLSVQPDQKHRTLFRLRVRCDLFGEVSVIVRDPHAHPPSSYRAAKIYDLRGVIQANQAVVQVDRGLLIVYGSDLHAPTSATIDRGR